MPRVIVNGHREQSSVDRLLLQEFLANPVQVGAGLFPLLHQFVIEEQTLRTQIGDAETMAGQLDRLLALMSLPAVKLGIIPARGKRHGRANCSFWIFDDAQVQVDTVSAGLDITQPAEIALYAQVFELLQRSAVYGHDARALIARALAETTAD